MAVPSRKPRTRTFNVRSLVEAIAGPEPKYPTYRFSRRSFFERQSLAITGVAVPVLTISTGVVPGGTVAVLYAGFIFVASGGIDPYSYAVTTGILPPGLILDSRTGEVAGTPTLIGVFPFTVTAIAAFGIGTSAVSVTIV